MVLVITHWSEWWQVRYMLITKHVLWMCKADKPAYQWWQPATRGRRVSWPGWRSWGSGCSCPCRETRTQTRWSLSPRAPDSPQEARGDLEEKAGLRPEAKDKDIKQNVHLLNGALLHLGTTWTWESTRESRFCLIQPELLTALHSSLNYLIALLLGHRYHHSAYTQSGQNRSSNWEGQPRGSWTVLTSDHHVRGNRHAVHLCLDGARVLPSMLGLNVPDHNVSGWTLPVQKGHGGEKRLNFRLLDEVKGPQMHVHCQSEPESEGLLRTERLLSAWLTYDSIQQTSNQTWNWCLIYKNRPRQRSGLWIYSRGHYLVLNLAYYYFQTKVQ